MHVIRKLFNPHSHVDISLFSYCMIKISCSLRKTEVMDKVPISTLIKNNYDYCIGVPLYSRFFVIYYYKMTRTYIERFVI